LRSFTPVFALSWTVVHVIDADSPLFGLSCDDLKTRGAEISVLLSGHHEGFRQEVHARHAYAAEDIIGDRQFADIFLDLPDGTRVLDFARFDLLE
jgi:inward rectifier potassium channel